MLKSQSRRRIVTNSGRHANSARRRNLRILGWVVVAVMLGWLLFATWKIVFPSQGQLRSASQAIVSLAPQRYRLQMAEQLVEESDTLVISYFTGDATFAGPEAPQPWIPMTQYCQDSTIEELICFTPEEATTIGEAHGIQELARTRSWDSITVVTSRYHAFRTSFIFERCFDEDIDVNVVYTEYELNAGQWIWHVVYEHAAFIKAAFETTARC